MAIKKSKGEQKMNKQFIIDHLDESEIDLSMCELSQVPVKELAMVPRGTRLDLSRNLFTTLPDNFGTLKHLIELDLSSNQLTLLPDSISQLILLQKLDLYSNKLTTLPLTFWQLKKLKWLDLRNNHLNTGLAETAGACVSEAECKKCASKILVYMKQKSAEHERKRQLQLQQKREAEKKAVEEERQRLEEARRAKAELKQRRKKEHDRLEQERARQALQREEEEKADFVKSEKMIAAKTKSPATRNLSCASTVCLMMASVVLLLLVPLVAAYVYCDHLESPNQVCSYWREYIHVTRKASLMEQVKQLVGLS